MNINPYIHFHGNCADAFRFYQKCLGGELGMMTWGETPNSEQVDAAWRDKITHAQLTTEGAVIMGADAPPGMQHPLGGFAVTINVQEPAQAEKLFTALAQGGNINMPLQQTFWAKSFGMLVDKFGVPWMVNCLDAPCGG
jgi:PhnB protein